MAQSSEITHSNLASDSPTPIPLDNKNLLLNESCPTTAASHEDLRPVLQVSEQAKQMLSDETNKYANSIVIEDDSDDDIILLSPNSKVQPSIGEKSEQNLSGKRQPQVELEKISIKKLHTETLSPKESEALSEDKIEKPRALPSRTRVLKSFWGPNLGKTKVLALDCEMVKVEGNAHEVARCSIVNSDGHVIFDHLIKPSKRVLDYVTWVHGILPRQLETCYNLEHYQKKIFQILQDSIIVGHSLKCDLEVIGFQPEKENIRDLAFFSPMRSYNCPMSLKNLVAKYLHVDIQKGAHNSVEDARAAMALYRKFQDQWEKRIQELNQS